MKSMSKKLMSIATTVVVSVSILSGFSNVKAAVIDKETVSDRYSDFCNLPGTSIDGACKRN